MNLATRCGARRRRPPTLAALCMATGLCALTMAGCSSSSTSTVSSSRALLKGTGPVDVLYAGSLVNLMEDSIGPSFDSSTGYTFSGFSAGSQALASDIKGQVRVGDVFISASPTVNKTLEGPENGSWVSWYAAFATSQLVLGYNPSSTFAAQLRSKPWYDVITEPGFLLGRTDPSTDPKGQLAVEALQRAATKTGNPALSQLTSSQSGVFPEETLVGRLQSGQLDAGFFYTSEAAAAHIPTVPIGYHDLKATYTVTILNRAPHTAAARSFVAFLFSNQGRALMVHDGLTLVTPPTVSGSGSVPPDLRSTLAPR